MSRLAKAGLWGAAFVVCAGAGVFLVSQGLSRASLWVTVVGLPIAIVGAAAGVWAAILAAVALREARQVSSHSVPLVTASPSQAESRKDAHVELVDASIDRKIDRDLTAAQTPPKDQSD